jgi:hypothetical protein
LNADEAIAKSSLRLFPTEFSLELDLFESSFMSCLLSFTLFPIERSFEGPNAIFLFIIFGPAPRDNKFEAETSSFSALSLPLLSERSLLM